ncbi:MAG TPA: glycosyltransferase [Nitrospinota bacterium]|nr:glycosyltransferase [Nitrospinota bacterium]
MRNFKKYSSAVRENVSRWTKKLKDVDILVGIPCYNNEDTIAHVVEMVIEGLKKYYSDKKYALFISDGGSLDDTREKASRASIPLGSKRKIAIYRGMPGKGTSFRALFELAGLLTAEACVVVDSDLRSITPEWIKLLADPILEKKAEFVTPYYSRHKYDGTITNHIIYPMIRSLYGVQVRQPIGGDFGFSGGLASLYAKEDVWNTDVARFGIDVWMTTTAINEGCKIVQANLGIKVHDSKDPSIDLGPMFSEVISTLFYLMGKYENQWLNISGSKPIEIIGELKDGHKIQPVSVTLSRLREELIDGFSYFNPLYRQIIEPDNYNQLKENIDLIKQGKDIIFPPELWAKILYDFAFTFQTWNRNRRKLVNIVTPLYFGRTAAYCQEVADMDDSGSEEVIEKQAQIFENFKPYLKEKIEAWK